jgi:outer membrane protein TolC
MSRTNVLAVIFLVFGISTGCVRYHPKAPPSKASFPSDLAHITVDASLMPLPELASHRFDPRDGLDMTEVAMLAVVNNPDLTVARDEAGIATVQAFAAGLLPDPQLAASIDFPTGNSPGNNYLGYNFGLSYDIGPLLVRSSVKAAAAADKRKADLNLLWQEWQVVAQARLLFVKNLEQKRTLAVLKDNRELAARHYGHSHNAFEEGNIALDAVTADFAALQDLDKQLNEMDRHIQENHYALNALLGLAPETALTLVGDPQLPELNADGVRSELSTLAARRPDLLALKAGYESQDLHLRQAIIAQFPALNVSVHRARDNSDVSNFGPGITLGLPIFNRNRGNIAVEEATRQRLYDELQNRLNGAVSEVERLLTDQALLERQVAELKGGVAEAERMAQAAETAFRQGNITETAYVTARGTLLGKLREQIQLEQSILEQRVALLAIIGGNIPPARNGRSKP